jgi:hypothetical protein
MDAAIGAPRGGGGHLCAGNRGEGRLKSILDGAAAGLGLPAEKAAAVVFEP